MADDTSGETGATVQRLGTVVLGLVVVWLLGYI